MIKSTGYFLAEILISLFLCASISLLLLKQQWQSAKYISDIKMRLHNINCVENKYERNFPGFFLSEILVCILLSSLIITGLMQQYSQIHRQNKILNLQIQENLDLQLVNLLLKNSIHSAGFTPCGNLDFLKKDLNINLASVKFFENSIKISRMHEDYDEFSHTNDAIQFLDKFVKNRQYLVADCYHIVLIANDNKDIGIHYITNNFIPPIYIGEYINEEFWVKNFKSLYYRFKHSERLTENIKSIQSSWLDIGFMQVDLILMNNTVQKLLVRIREK